MQVGLERINPYRPTQPQATVMPPVLNRAQVKDAAPAPGRAAAIEDAHPAVSQLPLNPMWGVRGDAAVAGRTLTVADRYGIRAYADQQDRFNAWTAGNGPIRGMSVAIANVSSSGGGAARSAGAVLDVRL